MSSLIETVPSSSKLRWKTSDFLMALITAYEPHCPAHGVHCKKTEAQRSQLEWNNETRQTDQSQHALLAIGGRPRAQGQTRHRQ